MTIEEKVKAYDEAIKRANELNYVSDKDSLQRKTVEHIFPELKESESEDERIRKELIDYLKERKSCESYGQYVVRYDRWIAWLEKQGEQKLAAKVEPKFKIGDKVHLINGSSPNYEDDCIVISDISNNTYYGNWEGGYFAIKDQDKYEIVEQKPADKIEPKFKIGDWAVSDLYKMTRYISEVHNDKYNNYYVIKGDVETECNIDEYDRLHHLWTIQDAKDGDVLHCWIDGYEFVLIYKGIKDGYITTYCHLYQNLKSFSEEPTTMFCRTIQGHFTPATKEQRDLLFQKMKEAGYEWDADKKELKKIEQKPVELEKEEKSRLMKKCVHRAYQQGYDTGFLMATTELEHKQEWSEEDKEMLSACIRIFERIGDGDLIKGNKDDANKYISFLKSLRPQKH